MHIKCFNISWQNFTCIHLLTGRVFIWSDTRERDILRFIFVNHTWKAGLFFIQYSFTFKFKSCAHMTCMVVVVTVGTCYMCVCIGRVWAVLDMCLLYMRSSSMGIWLTCPMGDVFRILWAMNETRVTCSEPPLFRTVCVCVWAINHHILCKSKVYNTRLNTHPIRSSIRSLLDT